MSEENKYYIPNIEDLYVGYECESTIFLDRNYDPSRDYKPIREKLNLQEVRNILRYSEGCLKPKDLSEWEVRTPYLTKEDIEREGWVICENQSAKVIATNGIEFYKNKKSTISNTERKIVDELLSKFENATFTQDQPYKLVFFTQPWQHNKIYIYDSAFLNHHIEHYYLFMGECKSINEFRKICKWLNIK